MTDIVKLKTVIDKFEELDTKYFEQFCKNFPKVNEEVGFGPNELFEMAIQAQVYLTELGVTAKNRFQYLGFDMMYPFTNPVDWYNWRSEILKKEISHTIYFSIGIRISSEIKRVKKHLEKDCWDAYCQLSPSDFSVSYKYYFEKTGNPEKISTENSLNESTTSERIDNGSISNKYIANISKINNNIVKEESKLSKYFNLSGNLSSILSFFKPF